MKPIFALLLAAAMTAVLFGCAAPAASEPQPQATTEGPALVTTADDLLEAIAPGAEILLGSGTFDLSAAEGYGKSESPCYTWEDHGNGNYSLVIQGVDGLSIRGCGQTSTSLVTEPRHADVIRFQDCRNVTLEDMTIGHTVSTEACEGGVLFFTHSSGITLKGLGLFGCGTTGVQAYECESLSMQSCEVYDCSISGLSLGQTRGVSVSACTFHSLGKDQPVSSVFSIYGCDEVTISDCMVSGNYVSSLLECDPRGTLTFRDNQFVGNTIAQTAFAFWGQGVVMADNVFENNSIRIWYAQGSCPALDLEGNAVTFEDPAPEIPAPAEAVPVTTGVQQEVRVSTPAELIRALASDTCIVLEGELLDLSTAPGYEGAVKHFAKTREDLAVFPDPDNANCCWVNNFDGPSLVIQGLSNLTIKAEGEDRKAHTISAVPRYADVLTFEQCSALTLTGFTAGHTVEKGSCTGGVFLLRNCQDVLIENCGMYGCGTVGVNGEFSRNIQIINSEIYECSISGITLSGCETVTIAGTLIRDIGDGEYGGSFFRFHDSKDVTLNGKPLDGNYRGN